MNAIAGIVSDALKKGAPSFLYIFIDPKANLPKVIMNKRKNQLWWLYAIADVDVVYSRAQCLEFVRQGIVQRYGMEPAQVLQQLFNTATGATVGTTLDDANAKALADIQIMAKQTPNSAPAKTNIWSDIVSVIEWISKLIAALGIKKGASSTDTVPTSTDWEGIDPDTANSSSTLTAALPYALGAGILFFLVTQTGKK